MIEQSVESVTLSQAGAARREAMRASLLREVDRTRGRRRLRRAGGTAAAATALTLCAWALWPTPPSPHVAPRGPAVAVTADAPPSAAVHMNFRTVHCEVAPDDPRIVRASGSAVESIGDDELIDLLRAAGHPGGLIRSGGAVVLTAAIPPIPEETPGS